MDLLPAFAGGGGALALARWRAGLAPAGAMGGDLLEDGLGEVVPQVPPIGDLHRVGQCASDRVGIRGRAIPADHLQAGMTRRPSTGTSAIRRST